MYIYKYKWFLLTFSKTTNYHGSPKTKHTNGVQINHRQY